MNTLSTKVLDMLFTGTSTAHSVWVLSSCWWSSYVAVIQARKVTYHLFPYITYKGPQCCG